MGGALVHCPNPKVRSVCYSMAVVSCRGSAQAGVALRRIRVGTFSVFEVTSNRRLSLRSDAFSAWIDRVNHRYDACRYDMFLVMAAVWCECAFHVCGGSYARHGRLTSQEVPWCVTRLWHTYGICHTHRRHCLRTVSQFASCRGRFVSPVTLPQQRLIGITAWQTLMFWPA